MTPRPNSLAEVASRTTQGSSFQFELADFLHEFARVGSEAMLSDQPQLLDGTVPNGNIFDAYLAAVAVSLSAKLQLRPRAWTRYPERILREPWFASPSYHMRALLLVESPAAFRERNLFVSANALSVA